ncbi:MAG TPA: tRNA 2-selenouridine(34) synthase MnmH [Gallionellaceae bacterium]|nr:tRNA 2-selenouridine(34) synthase MnmH [Gallionellaceae bacterium]
MRLAKDVTVSQLTGYDDIIDVRSPAEYAEDHIPGAISAPVLDNEERALVGTLYAQASPFEAKKRGAALISRNIATHLETLFKDKPRDWRPLVYCWRGGQRSGAMAHILAQVGWQVARLEGGYKTYRRHVLAELQSLPGTFEFRVVCGATGSGKSRLLHALHQQGTQVLDLEGLAKHRGSLLGNLPDEPQPAQKMFDSLVWNALRGFDPGQPVYVEAESRKIGKLTVAEALIDAIRGSACILIDAPVAARVQLLMEDYAHFLRDPALLAQRLAPLAILHGHKLLEHWDALARRGAWEELVGELLTRHYDPAYRRSTEANFASLAHATRVQLERLDQPSLSEAAARLHEPQRAAA